MYISSLLTYNVLFKANPSFECIVLPVIITLVSFVLVSSINLPPVVIVWIHFSTLCSLNVSVFYNFVLIGDFIVDFSNHQHPLFSKLFSTTASFVAISIC